MLLAFTAAIHSDTRRAEPQEENARSGRVEEGSEPLKIAWEEIRVLSALFILRLRYARGSIFPRFLHGRTLQC